MTALVLPKLYFFLKNAINPSSRNDLAYVFFANNDYWMESSLPDRFSITGLWIVSGDEVDISLRLVQAILYLIALSVAAFVLNKTNASKSIAVLLVVLMLFAPIAGYYFNFAIVDSLYMSLQILLISLLILVFLAKSTKEHLCWFLLVGLDTAAIVFTRMEFEFITLVLVCFTCIFVYKAWKQKYHIAPMLFFEAFLKRTSVRFLLVGAVGAVVELGTFSALIRFGIGILYSNFIAFNIALSLCFFLHYHYTHLKPFQGANKVLSGFLKYVLLMYLQFGIGSLLLWFLIDKLDWVAEVAKIFQIGVVTPVSYVVQKMSVFRRREKV